MIPTKLSHFDQATKTELLGKTDTESIIFTGIASNQWCIGDVPHVSYIASIVTDSVLQHFSDNYQKDLVALNCFYFSKTIPGPLIVEIEELKMSKKGYCVVRALLKQKKDLTPLRDIKAYKSAEWLVKLHCIFTIGNMDSEKGVTSFYRNPIAPSKEYIEPYHYAFMGEFLKTTIDATTFPRNDKQPGKPEIIQTVEFSDGRNIDFKSIPYLCDMFVTPPSLLGPSVLGGLVWCPTMQLEVQFKKRPTGKEVLAHFVAPHIINGRFDIDGEIWNENNEIVATTRHQCLIVPWSRNSKNSDAVQRRQKMLNDKSKL
ncbi:thioesterase-like superfamily-domain-containing protein [Mycotypha africana]|uniref:thioesterase-like superfamily-domain-containing protein n=1 Tax=Mycotypha africana TaxID=64632 RepID=UPI0023000E13|nr:thioesterase-like superfamily-domain-containing protein [Mycotypha africana]KAI8969204.1 thioesterase-like superfamily-domain-containing protein [Mycotypha africana]